MPAYHLSFASNANFHSCNLIEFFTQILCVLSYLVRTVPYELLCVTHVQHRNTISFYISLEHKKKCMNNKLWLLDAVSISNSIPLCLLTYLCSSRSSIFHPIFCVRVCDARKTFYRNIICDVRHCVEF